MQLSYVQDHKSIKLFNPVELPDFTILTGVNGSGKTHLLEAIIKKTAICTIDGEPIIDSIYFNYTDFIVKERQTNEENIQTITRNQNPNEISDILTNTLESIRSQFSAIQEEYKESPYEGYIPGFVRTVFDRNPDYMGNKLSKTEVLTGEGLGIENLEREGFADFFNEVYRKIYEVIDQLKRSSTIKRFHKMAKEKGVHLTALNADYFLFKDTFFGELLQKEIKSYRAEQAKNWINQGRANKGENVEFLTEDEFIERNGNPPWEYFNAILNEYGCNGFSINENVISSPEIYQSSENFQVNLWLKNANPDVPDIHVNDLSSGEKTLLALALTIYRQNKDHTFPHMILLDEIDANLHPSMIQQLLNALDKVFIKEDVKIILATHSPTTIGLSPEDSIYLVNKSGINRVEKVDKAKALGVLSEGFITFQEGKVIFEKILSSNKEIILFAEGDTDIAHINTAKNKLGITTDFDIFQCGGADRLKQFLIGIPDKLFENKVVIGVFDYDPAGINAIKNILHNFDKLTEDIYRSKSSSNVFAITLPTPSKEFVDYENCPIEYLYPKDVLENLNMLKKRHIQEIVTLKYIKNDPLKVINQIELDGKTDLRFYEIDETINSKRQFSMSASTLSVDKFDNFKSLFSKIDEIKIIYNVTHSSEQ